MDMPKLLGAAKSGRGQINMIVIAVAFVLSILVVNTYRQCTAFDPTNKTRPNGSGKVVYSSYILAAIVIGMCVLLFAYDIAIMTKMI
jgi:hypothetical protein